MKTLSKPSKLRISRVWIERKVDESPDLSHLGHYHNHRSEQSNEFTIDRVAREDCGRGEYFYFTPGSVEAFDANADWLPALQNETLLREYWLRAMRENAEKDYARMEAYNRGDWQMLGIIAKAEIISPQGVIQTVRSGGLWGIESDASAEYMAEVETEQLAELRAELESYGIGSRAIAYAFRNVERKD